MPSYKINSLKILKVLLDQKKRGGGVAWILKTQINIFWPNDLTFYQGFPDTLHVPKHSGLIKRIMSKVLSLIVRSSKNNILGWKVTPLINTG